MLQDVSDYFPGVSGFAAVTYFTFVAFLLISPLLSQSVFSVFTDFTVFPAFSFLADCFHRLFLFLSITLCVTYVTITVLVVLKCVSWVFCRLLGMFL